MARFALAFLLTSPPSMPLEFAYGGEAEADDGKADVVDAKGPGSFAARLFLDKKTPPAADARLSRRGAADDRCRRSAATARRRRARRAARHELPPPQIVDIQLFLDDYKTRRRRPAAAPPLAIGRRQAERRDDVQDDQDQPAVQAGRVHGEVGRLRPRESVGRGRRTAGGVVSGRWSGGPVGQVDHANVVALSCVAGRSVAFAQAPRATRRCGSRSSIRAAR